MYSNHVLYKEAGIPCTDIFILVLIRNYYNNLTHIPNTIVQSFKKKNIDYKQRIISGYNPPHYFTAIDNACFIQNENNLPIIYHYPRHRGNKSITYNPIYCKIPSQNSMFSYAW